VALRGVDLAVEEGQVAAVLGANGAGKTTMLRAVSGTVRRSGSIVFSGRRLRGGPEAAARLGIAHVPEGRGTFGELSVRDNLRLGAYTRRGGLDEDLERVRGYFPWLEERRDQEAGTLSGGEQQMLALARAFGRRPKLLLVDEPALGLAPRLVGTISDTLAHLHSDLGRTIVWVEQYAARVLALADIVYILGRGRIAWAGEPSELRASPVLRKTYLGGAA
jgi:branched-chain amino acid transport system ATP-binding protein